MRSFGQFRKSLLTALAVVFAAATILYSVLWILYGCHDLPVELGIGNKYIAGEHCERVQSVVPGSPAERAGMKPGDRILRVNGAALEDEGTLSRIWARHRPGDAVELAVQRYENATPLILHATFRANALASVGPGILQHLGQGVVQVFPLAFLTVGLAVLFLRMEDPNAWLLALMFGGFIAVPSFANSFLNVPSSLRPVAMVYRALFNNMVAAFFYFFFATFPARSPLDRRLPWLKWIALVLGAALALPVLPWADNTTFSATFIHRLILVFNYGLIVLGFVSLIANAITVTSPEARRKTRVILWGTLVGVVPATVVLAAGDFVGFNISLLLGAAITLLLWLFPLSFAYAVVKHRVLQIPVLLQRSARYVLVQRGYIVLLFLAAATAIVLFTHTLSRFFPAATSIGMAASAVFGIVLVWASAPLVKRGTERIDRAFFRSAYDARVVLQDLAEKTRTITDRRELASLLHGQITGALHPKSLACYLQGQDGNLAAEPGPMPQAPDAVSPSLPRPKFPFRFGAVFVPRDSATIPVTLPLVIEVARRGKAWDVPQGPEATGDLDPLAPECLVPILGRNSRMMGLLVLGQRLSEAPYSSEDKHLLESVASQAGITLENIDLAERMAKQMEAERRAAMELDIARRVQARLFPQNLPPLKTLDYAGGCLQARQVGGDYYDFLDMGSGTVGIVLADIAGKGISGALLMANLQANLRSQYAVGLADLPRLLQSVNRLFYENTTDESYATMFFGVYDDSCRSLRFANCGHIAPLIFRSDGSIKPLNSTTTVLGMFLDWESPVHEEKLQPGDVLVICTDGVTEAPNPQGEEYGECRLADFVRTKRDLPPNELLAAIQASVQRFSGATQADDITLIVGRCH